MMGTVKKIVNVCAAFAQFRFHFHVNKIKRLKINLAAGNNRLVGNNNGKESCAVYCLYGFGGTVN
jgi:hypothetical protein